MKSKICDGCSYYHAIAYCQNPAHFRADPNGRRDCACDKGVEPDYAGYCSEMED